MLGFPSVAALKETHIASVLVGFGWLQNPTKRQVPDPEANREYLGAGTQAPPTRIH